MFGIKSIRIWRIEKVRGKREEKTKEEEKKLEEKHEQEDYKKELERLKEKALEYVLTMSASDYVNGVGKKLTDYKFRLISVESGYGNYHEGYRIKEGCLGRMTREGERINAEIIVDIKPTEDAYREYLIGTALIPKKKQ